MKFIFSFLIIFSLIHAQDKKSKADRSRSKTNFEECKIKFMQIEASGYLIDTPIITSISDSAFNTSKGDTILLSSLSSITRYGKVPRHALLGFYPCGSIIGVNLGYLIGLLLYDDPWKGKILLFTTLSGSLSGYKIARDYYKNKNSKYEDMKNWTIAKKKTFIMSHSKSNHSTKNVP